MPLTYYELLEKMSMLDELTIIEILDISSEELAVSYTHLTLPTNREV